MNQQTGQPRFCAGCGYKIDSAVSYCPSCGENLTSASAAASSRSMDMGKLIVLGDGRNFFKNRDWAIYILIAVGLLVLGFILANQFGYRTLGGSIGSGVGGAFGFNVPRVRTGLYSLLVWGGVIGAAACIISIIGQNYYVSKTEIYIYENGIRGKAGGSRFLRKLEDTMEISSFQLEYSNISSVDITYKSLLSINAFGKSYVVGVEDKDKATEMVNIINKRIRLSATK
ncbi:MAG: zinc ribbon domain-containing protein [Defluviitaleaceae bacterium]|nr:zinc ribbon domain-containing protein [Defluviitaleaceae bacterium]